MKDAYIRGEIAVDDDAEFLDWWGINYTCPSQIKGVVDTLDDGEELKVKISSQGGSVSGACEIYSALREASANGHKVICDIQSEAYSAASMIAMAGDVVRMSPVARIMIHCASTRAAGNASDMEKMAEILRTTDKAIVQAYVIKTGKSEEELLKLMQRETWIYAKECVELHFADEIIKDETIEITNSAYESLLTPEMRERARKEIENAKRKEKETTEAKAAEEAKAEEEAKIKAEKIERAEMLRKSARAVALKVGLDRIEL